MKYALFLILLLPSLAMADYRTDSYDVHHDMNANSKHDSSLQISVDNTVSRSDETDDMYLSGGDMDDVHFHELQVFGWEDVVPGQPFHLTVYALTEAGTSMAHASGTLKFRVVYAETSEPVKGFRVSPESLPLHGYGYFKDDVMIYGPAGDHGSLLIEVEFIEDSPPESTTQSESINKTMHMKVKNCPKNL